MRCTAPTTSGCVGVARPRRVEAHLVADAGRALGEHEHAVGELRRLLDVVGHEHHGARPLAQEPRQLAAHAQPRQVVERRERLVHQQQVGLAGRAPAPARRAAACRPTAGAGSGPRRPVRPTSPSEVLGPAAPARPLRPRAAAPAACSRPTVSQGKRPSCWNTMRDRAGALDAPRVGVSQPEQRFSSVVLPQPEGPTSATNSPRGRRVERPAAPRTAPKACVTPIERAAGASSRGHRS